MAAAPDLWPPSHFDRDDAHQPQGNMMSATVKSRVREGLPHPLGATWDGAGINFALFSAHATRVELCLFDAAGERETARIELPE